MIASRAIAVGCHPFDEFNWAGHRLFAPGGYLVEVFGAPGDEDFYKIAINRR